MWQEINFSNKPTILICAKGWEGAMGGWGGAGGAGFKRSVHWPLLPKRRTRFCYVIIRATLNRLRMRRGASLKNSNYEAVMLWRVDRGEEGKNSTKDCNLYGYQNRGAKMTTGAQGITLRGSAELVADFFCKHFCGCLRCSCFSS